MSFLDAFQGYHQITLATKDQEKTTFISPDANYHYIVMPFGLKNVGATYQRMMTRMFRDKIRCMVEVYIDDMMVMSKRSRDTLMILEKYLKYCSDTSCISTPTNVPLEWGLASSSDI